MKEQCRYRHVYIINYVSIFRRKKDKSHIFPYECNYVLQ